MGKLRVLLNGVGGYGANWVRMLAAHPQAEAVAVVDIAPATLEAASVQLGLPSEAAFGDLAAALAASRPDLVVDTTPPRFRLETARRTFAAGADLITAKPLAESTRVALEMIRLARSCGRQIAVNQQQRYHPIARTLAECVAAGRIGEPVCSHFWFSERRAWHDRLKDVPSPLFVESSIHHFDLFRSVLQRPIARVCAVGWNPPDLDVKGFTAGSCWLQLEGGAYVVYSASRSSRNDLDPGYKTGWQGPWLIEGTEGVLRVDRDGAIHLNGRELHSAEAIGRLAAGVDLNLAFFDDYLAARKAGAPFALAADQNLITLAATECAEASVREGRWIEVDAYVRNQEKGGRATAS